MALADQGYERERFKSPIPHNFHCAICLNVLKHPMQCVRNEHSFCKPCITRYLKKSRRCPTCTEPLTLQTLRPSRVITDLVSQLEIKCDNVGRGCPVIIKEEILEDHVKDCGFGPVKCSNDGCELIMNRKDQAYHESNDCHFREGKCDVCGKYVAHGNRKLHCYVTRTEINEVKEELASIKEVVMNLSRELTRYMGDMNDEKSDMKDQVGNVNGLQHKTDSTAEEQQNMKEQKQSSFRSHSSSLPCLEQDVHIRNDVIIAGGGGRLHSGEIFSWTTRQWTPLPPMTSKRSGYWSFVHQGQMFACGGMCTRDSIEVLNLKEHGALWKEFPAKLPLGTLGHTSVIYGNDLFIFGGKSGGKVVNDIYKVSLVPPYSSQLVCHMAEPRTYHGAQCFGDKVVIVGGTTTGDTGGFLDTVLLYDITNNCCQTLAPLPFAVCEMATVAWKDNIIIIGGWDKNCSTLNSVVAYNITSENCEMLPSMKSKRSSCAAVVVNNTIVVMGGYNQEEGNLNSVECFNFCHYVWEELPPMKEERWGPAAAVKCGF